MIHCILFGNFTKKEILSYGERNGFAFIHDDVYIMVADIPEYIDLDEFVTYKALSLPRPFDEWVDILQYEGTIYITDRKIYQSVKQFIDEEALVASVKTKLINLGYVY